jgi:hypothetical protein
MKKIILLLAVLFITLNAYSQAGFGIKGGLNYVNNVVTAEDKSIEESFVGNKYRLSSHAGVFGVIELSEKFLVNTELLYSNKGYTSDPGGNIEKNELHLHYLNIPMLFGYKAIPRLTVLFGPESGYLISANLKREGKTVDVNESWSKRFDVGIAAGLRYHIWSRTFLEFRYIHGLSSVMDSEVQFPDDNGNSHTHEIGYQNRTFQLAAGFRIL